VDEEREELATVIGSLGAKNSIDGVKELTGDRDEGLKPSLVACNKCLVEGFHARIAA
jgi:hypothetical protein